MIGIRSYVQGSVIAAAMLGAVVAAPASAATLVPFANFSQIGVQSNLTWKNNVIPASSVTTPAFTTVVNGKTVKTPAKTVTTPAHDGPSGSLFSTTAGNANIPGSANVTFNFLGSVLAALGPLPARFDLLATSPSNSPAMSAFGLLLQPQLSGGFSFTYAGLTPLHVYGSTYLTGANLLTGTVGNVQMAGTNNGTAGWVSGSTVSGSTLTYTSDFLDFTNAPDRDFSLAFNAASPFLKADPGAAFRTFKANAVGNFAAGPGLRVAAVPEPATWAMMIIGFFGMGSLIRRRRLQGVAA